MPELRSLITGASGFCGGHLRMCLLNAGTHFATLSTRPETKADYHVRDVTDTLELGAVLDDYKPNVIFHLAGVYDSLSDKNVLYTINVLYALNILRAIEERHLHDTTILLVGSAAEYGHVATQDLPAKEALCARPMSHYGISKFTQTHIGLYFASRGFRVVVVRPSNIIGPGMSKDLLLGNIFYQMRQILSGIQKPVISLGDTSSRRDFIDVRDAAKIYLDLVKNPKAWGQIVNVCSGHVTPVRIIIETVIKLLDCGITYTSRIDPFRNHEVAAFCGDTNKLRNLLGFVPVFDHTASIAYAIEQEKMR